MSIGFCDNVDAATWVAHDAQLAQCCGSVCVAVVSEHFQRTRGKVLSLDELEVACGFARHRDEAHGTLRNWKHGTRPRPGSIAKVLDATDGAVDLGLWVHHALWRVLASEAPNLPQLNRWLEACHPRIRRVLAIARVGNAGFTHPVPERATVLAVRDLDGLDAFVAMLCLARRGEVTEDDVAHSLPSLCAYDMYPRLVVGNELIRTIWEPLAACVTRQFWRRYYAGGPTLGLDLEMVKRDVERRLANPRARVRPRSGRRLTVRQQLASERLMLEFREEELARQKRWRRREQEFRRRTQALFDSLEEALLPGAPDVTTG